MCRALCCLNFTYQTNSVAALVRLDRFVVEKKHWPERLALGYVVCRIPHKRAVRENVDKKVKEIGDDCLHIGIAERHRLFVLPQDARRLEKHLKPRLICQSAQELVGVLQAVPGRRVPGQ